MRWIWLLGVLVFVGGCSARMTTKPFVVKTPERLTGVVLDPSGAVIAQEELELRSKGKLVRSVRSENDGRYDFGEIQPGEYSIRIKPKLWCKPTIERSKKLEMDVRLYVCAGFETVT